MLRARTGTPAAPLPKPQHALESCSHLGQAATNPGEQEGAEQGMQPPDPPPWPPLNLAGQPPRATNCAPARGENQPGPGSPEKTEAKEREPGPESAAHAREYFASWLLFN